MSYVLPAATWDVALPLPRRPLPQAYHALRQILESAARRDIAAAQGRVHVLPAPNTRIANPIDFRDTAGLIEEGYRLATEWLAHRAAPAIMPAPPAPSLLDGSMTTPVASAS